MRNLSKRRRQSGFTLVELMVGIIVGLILALTLGTMLYYIFVAWRSNSDQVELQRDATFAMDMISRAIRPASNFQISIPSSSTLNIGTTSFYLGGTGSNSLYYDPDTTAAGDETELIQQRVTNLQFIDNTPEKSITINISLAEGGETLVISQATIGYRN